MFVGINFPSRFDKDNFTSRRTTGHNMYDPESLISGEEIEAGLTYLNSKRYWADEKHYLSAVDGTLSPDEILATAPRVRTGVHPITGKTVSASILYPISPLF